MTATVIDITGIKPISHREAYDLARTEYRLFADLLATIGDSEWELPTDCEGWTLRDLAGHMVGSMRSAASVRDQISQRRKITRRTRHNGGNQVDHMTAVRIQRTATLTPKRLSPNAGNWSTAPRWAANAHLFPSAAWCRFRSTSDRSPSGGRSAISST